ncbi:MAG: RNA 2',3'-cyclic phosphodiesterase [Hyphomicrobiales bacterium]
MPRLFTGIEIPASVGDDVRMLTGGLEGARWIDPENYHITLRFIGDIDDGTARDVANLMSQTVGDAFSLSLENVGHFGSVTKIRSLWAGVAPCQDLIDLHARQERMCQMAGLDPEGRKFSPHVTLARMRGKTNSLDVEGFLARNAGFKSAVFDVSRFVLFSAKPSTGGGPYLIEEAYDLA